MRIIISIFTLLFSLSLFANNTESKINHKSDKAKCVVENYALCLEHGNPGVVESALGNIIKFKYRCPNANIDCFNKHLKILAQSAENEKIRRKAELVSRILQNQDFVTEIGDKFYSEVDQFLEIILLSSRFKQSLLTNLTY